MSEITLSGPVTLDLNAGSDLSIAITWPNDAGGALDLTDHTAEVILASDALTGIGVAITDAEAGETTVTMTWHDGLLGLPSLPSFAVRIVPPDDGPRQATPRISLRYI